MLEVEASASGVSAVILQDYAESLLPCQSQLLLPELLNQRERYTGHAALLAALQDVYINHHPLFFFGSKYTTTTSG